jgi:ubiquinone/menaquinone biosynthesis C-methylase UbiE
MGSNEEARAWQTRVWDTISDLYLREIDPRFEPVVDHVISRAEPMPGGSVLDLGTGTGAVARSVAPLIGASGHVLGVDVSPEMLRIARELSAGLDNVTFVDGRGEEIPAPDASFDAVLAGLSLMYVIDRAAAARECARVLRPGGRLVAAMWAGPDSADIVRFQATAGRFAPAPPVTGVGPGALADPTPFVEQLRDAGIDARAESETTMFEFPSFDLAWTVLAGVTTASLPPEGVEEAKAAVRAEMWPDPDQPRTFVNETRFVVGSKRG